MGSNVERMTVTVTSEMARAIHQVVSSGAYASTSEVIREAMRDWQDKRKLWQQQLDQLRADISAGLEDIENGRVNEFNADRIIEKGKKKLASRSSPE